MPALTAPAALPPIKMLLVGESGAGKTGALVSLAVAGYRVRVIDLEAGIDILRSLLLDPKSTFPKGTADRVHFTTITEKMRATGGKIIPASATAWPTLVKMLERWVEPAVDGAPAIDLGKITDWTTDDVLCLDTLTRASDYAMNYIQAMNGRLGNSDPSFNQMRDIGGAQTLVGNLLALLTSKEIKCNVIVNSHITYVEDKDAQKIEGESTPRFGYPSAIGKALSPMIPRYFNSMLLARTEGAGSGARRMIYTKPIGVVSAKSSAPLGTPTSLPLATALADYFKAVRSGNITLPEPAASLTPSA